MVLRHWVAWKELEGAGRPWNDPRHRTYRGLRPINTAYLPTVDSVVENIGVVYRQAITTRYLPQQQVLGTYLAEGAFCECPRSNFNVVCSPQFLIFS